LKGLRAAVEAFWAAGIEEIYVDGSFCTEKPDPGDIDGYWVEPDPDVYKRIDPYWIDFAPVLVQPLRNGDGACGRITVSSSSSTRQCRELPRGIPGVFFSA
jgi:hypothetical protein